MKMKRDGKDGDFSELTPACNILCRVHTIGLGLFIVCSWEKPEKCIYSLSFGYRYLCKWELVYSSLKAEEIGFKK
jgi:hypothetical protein